MLISWTLIALIEYWYEQNIRPSGDDNDICRVMGLGEDLCMA